MNVRPRILLTPYLNTRPLWHHGAPHGCALDTLAPRLAVEAMRRGDALAAVVPVAGLARLQGIAELLGPYGIACRGRSESVLLCSREPFAALDATTRLALSADSMSSVRLLYLLLARRMPDRGVPRLVAVDEPVDAALIIGDAALRAAGRGEWPHVTDLATQWFLAHGRPMVFARWVVSTRASAGERARLRDWLDDYAGREDELRARAAAADHARAGLDGAAATRYLAGIRTCLDADDLAGQAIYERELARYPWPAAFGEATTHPPLEA
ncbi:MAG: MqnA/MqnD/SBP family protein [Gammaproteobacteria bacterium]